MSGDTTTTFDPIELEICWQNLISTVNEQAKALQRAAFSPIVREAGDLANAVFDRRGRMVAQAVTGTPGHINSLAKAVTNILAEHPVESLTEGDVLITNDPYKTAGQLLDVTVLVPVWRDGRLIAFFGSTIHHTDVGGYGIGAGGRDVFEEGLWIPIVKLMRAGERNDDVWRFILSNVRQPDHMAGDLHAQMASGRIGALRLGALCDQHGLDDIEDLADEIIRRSEEATRAAIRRLRPGRYESSALLDLADGSEIEIRCAMEVDADSGTITVDYTGSADASRWGINVVENYTHAYTTFTVRSVLSPEIPNNHGSLAPIRMIAPVGSIVNAVSPQPCTARHVVGMFLPNALLKALAQVAPEGAMAEGAGAVWTMQVSGRHDDGSPFITAMFTYAGGVGGRATKPGLDACSYPTGVAAVPIEVVEASAPVRFTRKALRPGSGGAGAQVGGRGQTIEFEVDTAHEWQLNAVTSRLAHAPEGIFGGEAGEAGAFLVNGEPVTTQARITLEPGDRVRLDLPGGGGYGHPPTPSPAGSDAAAGPAPPSMATATRPPRPPPGPTPRRYRTHDDGRDVPTGPGRSPRSAATDPGPRLHPPGGLPMTTTEPAPTPRDQPVGPPLRRSRPGLFSDEWFAGLDQSTGEVAEAATLPPELYTDPAVLAFERDALFAREWLCVGRAERLAGPGHWFTVTICDEPIIVCRDKAGGINALSAVCQHRAMQVCEGSGSSTTFTCPYHHWIYALDGRLLGAPAMERTSDFTRSEHSLPRLAVELWHGFIFVNLDVDAAPLAPTLASYDGYLTNYHLDSAVCPGTFTLTDLPWNWKVMFENFNDGYHANRLHQYVQDFCPSSLSSFPSAWTDDCNVIFREGGYTHIDGGFNATHRAIMPVFPELTEQERMRSTFALVPPTLCFGTAPDQCFFFLVRPTGPETIDVEIGYLFHPSALDDPLFEQKLKLSDAGVQVFVEQDQDATAKVQRGLRSRFAPRGRYSWQEESHVRFNRWLVDRYRRQRDGA